MVNKKITIIGNKNCRPCQIIRGFLRNYEIPHEYLDVKLLANRERISHLLTVSNKRTVPQLFVDDIFISEEFAVIKNWIDSNRYNIFEKPVFTAHYVLEMENLVQKCVYCGLVIEDYRNAVSDTPEYMLGWKPGMIFINGNMTTINPGEDFEMEYCCDKHKVEAKSKMN